MLGRFVWVVVIAAAVASCSSDGGGGSGSATETGGSAAQGSGGTGTPGSSGGNPTVTNVTLGQTRTGEGTYYAATGDGACMFGPSPNAMDVAALNQPDWAGSALCGACADVTGPNGSVRVRIVDLCPECQSGDLDFSQQAFAKIAQVSAGRVPISWTLVACDVTGPVSYRYKDGSNQWWTAVQVLNSRLPVTTLEYSPDGSSWNPTERQDYNYFLAASGFGPNPVEVRITAIDGQRLADQLPAVQALLVTAGHAQFN
jgi:expansin (peptidoglycan-binding protein)